MVGVCKKFENKCTMTKNIIILNSHYLTRHNFKIHGLDYFKKNSNCIIYDLSYLTSKLLKKNSYHTRSDSLSSSNT